MLSIPDSTNKRPHFPFSALITCMHALPSKWKQIHSKSRTEQKGIIYPLIAHVSVADASPLSPSMPTKKCFKNIMLTSLSKVLHANRTHMQIKHKTYQADSTLSKV